MVLSNSIISSAATEFVFLRINSARGCDLEPETLELSKSKTFSRIKSMPVININGKYETINSLRKTSARMSTYGKFSLNIQ